LTKTVSSGSGTSLIVADVRYFSDGFGLIPGDLIQLEGQTQTARVTAINYSTNTLTLDRSLSWSANQGVAYVYTGTRPDIGAYEYSAQTAILYGDVSSDTQVTAFDAALTAQAAVGLITLTPDQTKAADVSGDSQVTAFDAALIAQRAVGLIDKFPVE